MSLWTRLRRRLCPACAPVEASAAEERRPAIAIMERSAERLDRILARMAEDDNPLLGEPPRVPRRRPR